MPNVALKTNGTQNCMSLLRDSANVKYNITVNINVMLT